MGDVETAGGVIDEARRAALLRLLFLNGAPDAVARLPTDFFSPALLRAWYVSRGDGRAEAGDAEVADLYLSDGERRRVSPNPLFDEPWYRLDNPDVAAEIDRGALPCGFAHFVTHGIREGRWPNPSMPLLAKEESERPAEDRIDDARYVAGNAGVRSFMRAFPWITPLDHYNLYGRHLGYVLDGGATAAPGLEQVLVELDRAFYRERYMAGLPDHADVSAHYLNVGLAALASPTPWFDEGWYRAFYPDVAQAIDDGLIPFGFYHFVLFGRTEGRLPSHDLTRVLEAALPGVTQPTLLLRLDGLRRKLAIGDGQLDVGPPSGAARVWFVMPVLNPDIAFGGYQAAFGLMVELRRKGFRLGIFCAEEERPNLRYFLWRLARPDYDAAFDGCLIVGKEGFSTIALRRGDLAVAYSVWGLRAAARLARHAGDREPYLLAQEYEPIFYENDTLRVLCENQYEIAHVPLINSSFLLSYFRAHRVGPFARDAARKDGFHVFEHKITPLRAQTASEMAARRTRVLVAYARPEMHAGRNLFEMIVLALEQLCEAGVFGPHWSFVGLGALSQIEPVPLGRNHALRMTMKMSEEAYGAFMAQIDIGISLMCAPHPSVVPFELATTGALVVTNTYENRSAAELEAICGNIVPCDLGIDKIADAIRQAVERVEDVEQRAASAFRPAATSWRDIFHDAALQAMFGAPERPATP